MSRKRLALAGVILVNVPPASQVPGVRSAEAHYAEGLAMVVTDGSLVDPTPLIRSVERAGCRVAGATRKP